MGGTEGPQVNISHGSNRGGGKTSLDVGQGQDYGGAGKTARKQAGLGTAFFYVLNASFFCILLKHATFFCVLLQRT